MTTNTNTSTNAIIKDVTFAWVHLDKAVSPFGTDQYDIQIQVPKARKSELEKFGTVKEVKDKDGKVTGAFSVSLKKKAFKADGEPAMKPRVVDAAKNPMSPEDVASIGNGSKGNVIVTLRPFEIKGPNGKVTKSGISKILSAVQVTEMKVYKSEGALSMFDDESSGDEPSIHEESDF
jgi:hypothetical protein